jgi:methanogenic corrinoid protein MtbC1
LWYNTAELELDMADLKQLYQAVVAGDAKTAATVTQQALQDGVEPMTLVSEYMIPAMD